MDGDTPPGFNRGATAQHPLLGLTVLLVEDSRHASEGIRLLCQRSGARLRRADSLASARRHLRVYRPGAAIVDIGLPDGSGLTFLRELAEVQPRIDIVIATSGDPDARAAAIKAGADLFLLKPVANLAAFQSALLGRRALAAAADADIPRGDAAEGLVSLRDDLHHAARLLDSPGAAGKAAYIAQFLSGVASIARDAILADLAQGLTRAVETGGTVDEAMARLGHHLDQRLRAPALL